MCGPRKNNPGWKFTKDQKIKYYLANGDTFCYRREGSLHYALSKLTITTCHKDTQVASKLDYDHSGKLLSITPCARQTGTTVTLQNLFSTLPVRHKEFQRNLKKEFNKMVQVLNAYCIISTKVKLTCTNLVGKGKKNIIVNTNGNDTMKENITNIFGSKQIQSLIDFAQCDPRDEECTEYSLKNAENNLFKIKGFVSTCVHGQGRSATDRQFLFVNKRPCDLIKVSRVVNEVYHMYNRQQYPFIVLDITLNKDSVDVNVTPDKRQVFVENEKLLLATIKASLIKLLEPQASVYQMNHGVNKCINSPSVLATFAQKSPLNYRQSSPADIGTSTSQTPTLARLKRSFTSAFSKENSQISCETNDTKAKQRKLDTFIVKSTVMQSSEVEYADQGEVINSESNYNSNIDSDTIISVIPNGNGNSSKEEIGSAPLYSSERLDDEKETKLSVHYHDENRSENDKNITRQRETIDIEQLTENNTLESKAIIYINNLKSEEKTSKEDNKFAQNLSSTNNCKVDSAPVTEDNESSDIGDIQNYVAENISSSCGPGTKDSESTPYEIKITKMDEDCNNVRRKETKVTFSLSRLKQVLQKQNASKKLKSSRTCRSFRAKITPGDNTSAEEELQKQISKEMFPKMDILGQFNLGFIIAKHEQDLFIIDQHATDEKYNFENLQRHTVIQNQKLIQPQTLELTAANETILMDNLDVFHKNGFEFRINEEDPPTQRVKLISMPVSKNWSFGKDDIEELIFMLSDTPGVMCRPTRVRMMFASRACRKSIMIGTALNKAEMKKLVFHMSEIDQPWANYSSDNPTRNVYNENCPHGRPTMRHLINLDMLPD